MKGVIYGQCWSNDTARVNFGDYIGVYLFQRFGYGFRDIRQAPLGAPCVMGVGTILSQHWLSAAGQRRVIVWGSGIRSDPDFVKALGIDFRAVRGPVTAQLLGLGQDVPLGDPALLLPHFIAAPSPNREVLAIQHCLDPSPPSLEVVTLSPWVEREHLVAMIQRIASAEFVFSASLHGAIVAAAFGVPWAAWVGGRGLDCPIKWEDWAAYLGLPGRFLAHRSLKEGQRWWQDHGRYGVVRATEELIAAFPHDAAC